MKRTRIPVFINERSGTRKSDPAALARALEDAGAIADIHPVEPVRLAATVQQAAESGTAMIGVAGGDGSLRTAAEVLAGSRTVLAPLPLGTLNHFARRLGLGTISDAARAAGGGSAMQVPLGIVDDHVFLNTATFGIYADVVRRRERWRRWLTKWPAAALAAAVSLPRLQLMQVALDAGRVRLERETPLVWVGLGKDTFPFAHEAELRDDEPVLEVVVVRAGSGWSTAATVARLLARLARREPLGDDPGLEVFHTRSLVLFGPHSIGVTLDGELRRWKPPLFITVQKEALLVASPGEPQAADAPAGEPQAADGAPAA